MTPVQALQKALAAEHAAVHLYGVLGGQSSKSRQPVLFRRLDEAYEEHRDSRDRLTVLISAKGRTRSPPRSTTPFPGRRPHPSQIEAVARTIERRVTKTYGELVENTAGNDRRWAITALDASALRELDFGVPPSDFPGLR